LPTTFGKLDRPELSVAKIVGRIPNLEGHRPGVPVGVVTSDRSRDHAAARDYLDVDAVRVLALLQPCGQGDASRLIAGVAVVHGRLFATLDLALEGLRPAPLPVWV